MAALEMRPYLITGPPRLERDSLTAALMIVNREGASRVETGSMKRAMLLAVMFSASATQSQPLADASSWYVLMGKHREPWSLCYANVVAEKFKDGTYVEAEAAESANRNKDVQCKLIPPTADEKQAQEECDEALKDLKLRESEKPGEAAGVEPLSKTEARADYACQKLGIGIPRVAGGLQRCVTARWAVERSQVLTVTKRLGPYPTADQAADALRAEGWRTGTNPSSGDPIWFKKYGCEQNP